MSLIMRDSVNPGQIPLAGLSAVAGYGDGRFQWTSADWARFPAPIVPLSIVVFAADAGDILDVETGDATPAQVPGWCRAFNRPRRRRPTIYSSRSTWQQIVTALQAAGLSAADVDWWAATLDGTQQVAGAVAVQYRDFGGYDESIILDPSWVGGTVADLVLSPDDQRNVLNCGTYVKDLMAGGTDPADPNGTSFFSSHMKTIDAIQEAVQQLQSEVAKLQQPQVDASALAAALVADSSFLAAIATAVEKGIGAKLSA